MTTKTKEVTWLLIKGLSGFQLIANEIGSSNMREAEKNEIRGVEAENLQHKCMSQSEFSVVGHVFLFAWVGHWSSQPVELCPYWDNCPEEKEIDIL